MGKGFYVVNGEDEVGSGPYPSKEEAENIRDLYYKGQKVRYGDATHNGHFILKTGK